MRERAQRRAKYSPSIYSSIIQTQVLTSCHQETTVLHLRAPRKVDMMDPPLDLTFNGSSGQTAARHQCHLGVQRSLSGSDTQRNQGYHCQWSGRRCMCWAIYVCVRVCVCAGTLCIWRGSVRKKEQIDRAEREMHFSNITLSCHPLRFDKEQRENIKTWGGGQSGSIICSVCLAREEMISHSKHIQLKC